MVQTLPNPDPRLRLLVHHDRQRLAASLDPMFRITTGLPSHVVGFEIDGTVTRPDIEALYREVDRAMDGGHVHLVGTITGVGGLTLDALGANFGKGMSMITQIGKVDRYAIVTDTPWIARLGQLQGSLLPGLTVQVWPTAELDDAIAWASEPLAS